MSCRVLVRGVEQFLMNCTVEHAIKLGLPRITAEFIPTAKNGMVATHYSQLGFAPDGVDGDETLWRLDLAGYTAGVHHIRLEEAREAAA